MADILVTDWMEEFESLTESEIHTYSTEQEHNHEVMVAIYDVLGEPYRVKGPNVGLTPKLVKSHYRQLILDGGWNLPTIARFLQIGRGATEEIHSPVHTHLGVSAFNRKNLHFSTNTFS